MSPLDRSWSARYPSKRPCWLSALARVLWRRAGTAGEQRGRRCGAREMHVEEVGQRREYGQDAGDRAHGRVGMGEHRQIARGPDEKRGTLQLPLAHLPAGVKTRYFWRAPTLQWGAGQPLGALENPKKGGTRLPVGCHDWAIKPGQQCCADLSRSPPCVHLHWQRQGAGLGGCLAIAGTVSTFRIAKYPTSPAWVLLTELQ
jgi:hypothetical protein